MISMYEFHYMFPSRPILVSSTYVERFGALIGCCPSFEGVHVMETSMLIVFGHDQDRLSHKSSSRSAKQEANDFGKVYDQDCLSAG